MLQTGPRIAPRISAGTRLAIDLLPLGSAAVLARAALVAAGNPALRIAVPEGGHGHHPLFDPDGIAAASDSLIGHILRQIGGLRLTPRQRVLALMLTEALEPTGWLVVDLGRLTRACGVAQDEMEAVLRLLQTLEPSGVFARSLAECLRIQAIDAGSATEAVLAVLERLPRLADGDVAGLARDAGLPLAEIERAVRQIRALNPKPGLAFTGPMPPAFPPDVMARRTATGWRAERHPALPRLEVYKAAGDPTVARLWHQAIERRADLGVAIANLVLTRQQAFLDGKGDLLALTSAELAKATGMHVATVNRVLKGTTMATPSTTGPLRLWTARPVQAEGGPSTIAAKRSLARLLSDPAHASLSDAGLSHLLSELGIRIARRTVAKYRAELTGPHIIRSGIERLPSSE